MKQDIIFRFMPHLLWLEILIDRITGCRVAGRRRPHATGEGAMDGSIPAADPKRTIGTGYQTNNHRRCQT
jgi:hypothetical protein